MFELKDDGIWIALAACPDDPSELPTELVEEGFAKLQRLSEAVEAKKLRWLADLERRTAYRKDGYLSGAAWLTDRFGLSGRTARDQIKVATALEDMPQARRALDGGEVSSSAVRVLVEARETHPEQFSQQEQALVEQAQTKGVDELRRVVSEWSQSLDEEDSSRRPAERMFERRRLDVCSTANGMVRLDGELDPESGEHVMTALQAMVDSDLRAGASRDLRTPAQRRADALVELACGYLSSPDRPSVNRERPHVVVTVNIQGLRGGSGPAEEMGRAELDHAGAVHPEAARRIACDAAVMRVVMAGRSEPLDVGRRTSVISARLRRAVVLRDGACRFPECGRPHAWCDAHHIRHWADGGTTALSNLLLLCRPHHRLVHEGGFALELAGDRPVFRRPDGSVIKDRRAPPEPVA